VAWIEELVGTLSIPPLSAYGLTAEAIPDIAAQAAVASSTKANPVRLPVEELEAILRRAVGPG
jgi:alcohol dehydrogenase class IV